MNLLQLIVIAGIAAAGAVNVVRAVVPTLWLLVKPFSCDLCMSWWSSLAVTIAYATVSPVTVLEAAIAVLGGTALSLILVKLVGVLSESRIDSQVADLAVSADTGTAEEESSHVR
jgi:hypothetical protein